MEREVPAGTIDLGSVGGAGLARGVDEPTMEWRPPWLAAPPRPTRRLRRLLVPAAAALLLVAALAGAGTVFVSALRPTGRPPTVVPPLRPADGSPLAGSSPVASGAPAAGGPSAADPAGNVVTAPLGGRSRAGLELVTGVTTVTLRGADLAGDLYRISTPAGGSRLPAVLERADRLTLQLVPSGRRGPDAVEIQLSARVTWSLRLTGGAAVRSIDTTGLGLTDLAMTGGSGRTELSLARPAGTVPVRMIGGVGEFTVRLPENVPARVRLDAGAATVVLDDQVRRGVAAGTVLTSANWGASGGGYEIDVVAGATAVTVGRRA